MDVLTHILFIVPIALLIVLVYLAWCRDWGVKQYEAWKKLLPYSLMLRRRKNYHIWYYKISVIVSLFGVIALYAFVLYLHST